MHHSLRPQNAGLPTEGTLAQQMRVGEAEQAIMDLLPASTTFIVTDTLTRTRTPLFEPLSLKMNVLATMFAVWMALLRTEQLVPVRSPANRAASALQFRTLADRKRIRPRRIEDGEESAEDEDAEGEEADSELDSD